MTDESSRGPWDEGPDEEAPPESWLGLDDEQLLQAIETLDAAVDEDERLLEIVTSRRHFFIRQEAAKRIRDRRRLYPFEDDRHVGQILVRHLSRREDVTYLERISLVSRHVEVRKAAQVQLARVWRYLEDLHPRDTQSLPKVSLEVARASGEPAAAAAQALPAAGETPSLAEAAVTSAPLEGDKVDGSLLGWAAHFLIEQVWSHLGTAATKEILCQRHAELSPRHATLVFFSVHDDARVKVDLTSGPRIPGAAVGDVAVWMAEFRRSARRVVPEAAAVSVRVCTTLMADALNAAGFYTACDEAGADAV
jgi:hypothetical protein